ncbi:MAG TPA: hypothetical protein VFB99_06855, partial [Vicinamibacterales bacterium]|nr:hypothetical protein [Vicinamibacterales bacterium]
MMKVAMALLGLFCFGCGGNEDLFNCTPGRQETCPCEGGGQGIQVCGADGTFGACDCAAGS